MFRCLNTYMFICLFTSHPPETAKCFIIFRPQKTVGAAVVKPHNLPPQKKIITTSGNEAGSPDQHDDCASYRPHGCRSQESPRLSPY